MASYYGDTGMSALVQQIASGGGANPMEGTMRGLQLREQMKRNALMDDFKRAQMEEIQLGRRQQQATQNALAQMYGGAIPGIGEMDPQTAGQMVQMHQNRLAEQQGMLEEEQARQMWGTIDPRFQHLPSDVSRQFYTATKPSEPLLDLDLGEKFRSVEEETRLGFMEGIAEENLARYREAGKLSPLLEDYNRALKLMRTSDFTGKGTEFLNSIRGLAHKMRLDVDRKKMANIASAGQTFMKGILKQLEQLGGSDTFSEQQAIKASSPSLEQSREGNIIMLQYAIAKLSREMDIREMIGDMMQDGSYNQIDIEKAVRTHLKENDLSHMFVTEILDMEDGWTYGRTGITDKRPQGELIPMYRWDQ